MTSRWIRTWAALVAAGALLLPTVAVAQQGEVEWEDAPAQGDADTAPAPTEGAAPSQAAPQPVDQFDDRDPRALTDFAAELEPYGYWRDDATYGRVWVPHQRVVGQDFSPYVTSGHWAVAEDGGWIWVSDYPFGWVVFHYGRWVWISGVGWSWIPGRVYANAWVVWRVGEPGYAYIGWAPMPPEYVWFDGVAVGVWFGLYTPWVFCPSAYVYHHHLHSYVLHDHHHVHVVAGHTRRYQPPRGQAPYAGPPPRQAHVPAKAIPQTHTPANPKAAAASRPTSGTAARVVRPGGRPSLGAGTRRYPPSAGGRLDRPRTLSGTSDAPMRTTRPSPLWPGASRTAPGAVPRGSAPSRSQGAPPSRSYGYPSGPSRGSPSYGAPPPSRPSAPSRPSGGYRYAPRAAPQAVPVPAPSAHPAGRPSGRGGRGGRR